jgi:phosphatidylinositol glycan class K
VDITSQHTMKDLFDSYDRNLIHSTPGVRTDLFRRRLDEVKITDFFGNVQSVEIGGEGEVIDEDLLGQQRLNSQPKLEGNDTVIALNKDTLEAGSHGFEVKVQDGHVWVKGVSVIACVILWIAAKKML